MGNRRRYDDKFRAAAVVMLEAQGYPEQKGALQAVAAHLKMPATTLHGWAQAKHNPPPTDIRTEKKGDLAAMLRDEIEAVLSEAPNARDQASYRDLMTGLGIMVDKLQLLTGEATERTEIVSDAKEQLISRLDGLRAANRDSSQPIN